ncbi:gliding motility-associated C-terminal domain-containing protein [Ekhidna sp.]|uniref:T9SS type B sorting domain-containing protein n=1 Tax=Ekhidna sp. TaxID=2608089 RepID=UPI003CCBE727
MKHFRYILFLLLLTASLISRATHIRAGEVIVKHVSGLTYEITFIGYRDVEGVPFGQGILDVGVGQEGLYGDDPDENIPWGPIEDLGNGVEKWSFTVAYTYPGPGNYLVSYKEDFRNAEIQNISGSISTTFYVETLVVIDPLLINSTPFFTVPPIDQGVVGGIFEHNPGAFDPDGDSLSYFFTTPKQDRDLEVNGYLSLIDPSFYENFGEGNSQRDGEPTLSIDPSTGTLTWDAPGGATIPDQENREFNVAFVVEEWRRVNGELIRLGFVTRDMQIIIWDYENEPPELEIPEDTCVVAGETITSIITGTDPDGDPVKIEAFGGPFEVSPSASVSPDPGEFQGPPSILNFEWGTSCSQVRIAPYEVQFKATDQPNIPGIPNPPGLVNFETWRITVVGPPPTGLTAETTTGRRIELAWDDYSCTNADSMQVWRRVGEFEIDPTCNPGIPENSGYELIETLGINETSYVDNNAGIGLSPGSKYCYRLVAKFPLPAGGTSIASEEACDSLIIDTPVITKVSVEETDEINGVIALEWTEPIQRSALDAPYQYEVLRRNGQGFGNDFVSIDGPSTNLSFTDTGLNTEDNSYSYKIVLYDNTNQPVDTSQQASSVWLSPTPLVGAIQLDWEANVPWSNSSQSFPYHYIWRDNVNSSDLSSIQLIDSVDVTVEGLSYLDDGRFNGIILDEEIEYCYYITTSGTYDNELLPEPLLNNAQIVCVQPNDTIPPCPPVSVQFNASLTCEQQLESIPCGIDNQFSNEFSWIEDGDPSCDDDIQQYRIYFSPSGLEESFELLAQTNELSFSHSGLTSLAGCYQITAVDRSGNESISSEVICNDNCPRYILPNVITPNGDGKNDTFRPLKDPENCPRFVESVLFKVFNRAGAELFEYDSDDPEKSILINWDGTNKRGQEVPAGIYYYSAEIRSKRLNPDDEVQVINGWVQIIR